MSQPIISPPPKSSRFALLIGLFIKPIKVLGISSSVLIGIMLLIDLYISYAVKDRVYTDISHLPKRPYALVLGTAKYYPSGNPNLYYRYRLVAAQQLYQAKKADHFLMSGDNQTPFYNEPKMMTEDLITMGLPANHIEQDYAGYSTLDSILRADKVFRLPPFTIVSQRFHCERALLIAQFHHIDAICFTAHYPEQHYKVRLREVLARSAMLFKLLLGAEAKTFVNVPSLEPTKK